VHNQQHHSYGLQPKPCRDLEKHYRDIWDCVEKSRYPWLSTGIGFEGSTAARMPFPDFQWKHISQEQMETRMLEVHAGLMVTHHSTEPLLAGNAPAHHSRQALPNHNHEHVHNHPAPPFPSDLETFHTTTAISRGEKGPNLALGPNLLKELIFKAISPQLHCRQNFDL